MKKIITAMNSPIDSKTAFTIYLAVIVFGAILLCSVSCKTEKQLAAEKERTRRAEISLLEKTRQEHPCDTFRTRVDTLLQFVKGDTVVVDSIAFVENTKVITRTVTKFVVDSAWVQQYRDSLTSSNYAFDVARQDAGDQKERGDKLQGENKSLTTDRDFYRRIVWIGGVILTFLFGAAIVLILMSSKWQIFNKQ